MHAFFRSSRGLGKIYHSCRWTKEVDGVDEWSSPALTNFENPNSGVDTIYHNDRLFLVYNPSSEQRSPLVIAELDEDFCIVDELVVEEKVKEGTYSQELSYPYMVEKNNKIHLVYTYGRCTIEYVTIEI